MPLGKERPYLRLTQTLTTLPESNSTGTAELAQNPAKPQGGPESSNSSSNSSSSRSSRNRSRSSCSSEWQAILYLDSRASGKLLNPSVRVISGFSSESSTPVDVLECKFTWNTWQPIGRTQFLQPLSIPLQQLRSTSSLSCTLFHFPRGVAAKKVFPGSTVPCHNLTQAICQEQQRIDYIREQQRRFQGQTSKQDREQHPYIYEKGDGHSRTALTFHNVEGVLRLCVIQLSLAVPRQDLDELALGSMSAPTSLQHSSEQQQHQHQHQHQPHEHEQATCPQSGGVIRDEVGGPRNSVSAAGVSSRSDGSADSLDAGVSSSRHQTASGKSKGGSPPNGTSTPSRTHRRPEVHRSGVHRSPSRHCSAASDEQQALVPGVPGDRAEAPHTDARREPAAKESAQQGSTAGCTQQCSGVGGTAQRQLETDAQQQQQQQQQQQSEHASSTIEAKAPRRQKHLGPGEADAGGMGACKKQPSTQQEDSAAVIQNGKVRNGVIAYAGGALLPHSKLGSHADSMGPHGAQPQHAHSASSTAAEAAAGGTHVSDSAPLPGPPTQALQAMAGPSEHAAPSQRHAGLNGSASSSGSPPTAAQLHRGSTRSEPPSHACSPPRAPNGQPEQRPPQQQHGAGAEHAAAARGSLQGPGSSSSSWQPHVPVSASHGSLKGDRGHVSISTRHSVGDPASDLGQPLQGRGDDAAAATASSSSASGGGSLAHRYSVGDAGHASGSSRGGGHTRGMGHSHSFDASNGGGGSGRGGGGGQTPGSSPAAPLPRGRGSRGSSGSLSAAGGGGGGKHGGGGGHGHHPRGGQLYSPRWGFGGGGASGRLSVDEVLLAQSQQLGNGPHMVPHKGGSQAMLDTPVLSPVGHEPAASADLERFLVQVTPMINVDLTRPLEEALPALSLEDVWRFYHDPSLHGREVYTLGGARGPSVSYFVPYLSAMQLFTPASPKDPGTNRLYVCDTEGWPKHMHLRFEHFETELPFNRAPLYDQIDVLAQQLAASSSSGGSSGPAAPSSGGAQASGKPQQCVSPPSHAASASAAGSDATPAGSSSSSNNQAHPSATPAAASASTSSTPSTANAGSAAAAEAGTAAKAEGGSAAANRHGDEPPQPPRPPPLPQAKTASQLPASLGAVLREQLPPGPSLLRDVRIAELHPASWYAVAWYPVYRIPDAPLVARFLTFHSFAPLVSSIQNTLAALQEGQQRPMQLLPVGVVGLKWYNMHNERWLEALHEDGPGGQVASAMNPDDPSTVFVHGPGGYGGGYGGGRGGGSRRNVQAQQMDIQFQAHLSELQATAERLARGHGLRLLGSMGSEELRLRHPDFEFFNSRS